MKRRLGVLALVGLCVVAAGCGSKSYGAKLSAMCEDFAQREQEIGEPRTPEELAQRGDRLVAAYEDTILRPLERVEPPDEFAQEGARLRQLARQQRDALQALADAGKQGNIPQLRRLAVRNAQLNAQAGEIARQVHADSCTA